MNRSFTWPNDARLAMSFVINIEEGSEMSTARGDKGPEPVDELGVALKAPIRNYVNESNYQYGVRAGAARIFGAFAKHRIATTVTAAAMSLENAPELATMITSGGHETCSHGWRWIHQFSYDEAREREFIDKAVKSIEATTGTRPYGWLSRYLHTDRTHRLLVEAGFEYHMDDLSDDTPRWQLVETSDGLKPLVIVPYALDTNDMKFWLAPGYTPAQWLEYAVATFDRLYEEGADGPKMMSLGLHLRIIGRPGRIAALEQFIQHVVSHQDVWCAPRLDIARHFAAQVPAPTSEAVHG
ncbi:polysaccharide deacetylase family protein [Oceanibacterium hippocampi]|uniref:Chitooligosaccharide deacetylase n=1 Tax=Oceanibacterium hippocampi TaxID=745714 RepID=A0A1Y5U2Q8_9PROT|nr:polysaccharide deacetylase family protein [Oceanibacterium hippocampi]SLN75412.1 Peptidoglycan deacetylase [Oceanibacterium hippocampi]